MVIKNNTLNFKIDIVGVISDDLQHNPSGIWLMIERDYKEMPLIYYLNPVDNDVIEDLMKCDRVYITGNPKQYDSDTKDLIGYANMLGKDLAIKNILSYNDIVAMTANFLNEISTKYNEISKGMNRVIR